MISVRSCYHGLCVQEVEGVLPQQEGELLALAEAGQELQERLGEGGAAGGLALMMETLQDRSAEPTWTL